MIRKQWVGVIEIFGRYWNSYGGLSALVSSPYLHVSLLLTILTFGYWSDNTWWTQSLSVLPTLMGFTLGGFAIFLSLGSENFRSLMARADEDESTDKSPYMVVISSFVHFVLIQMFAIITSIIANAASYTSLPSFVTEKTNKLFIILIGGWGYGLFIYSLLLAISVCLAIYRMSGLFAKFKALEEEKVLAEAKALAEANEQA